MAVNFRGEVKRVAWTPGCRLDAEGQALLLFFCPLLKYTNRDLGHFPLNMKS